MVAHKPVTVLVAGLGRAGWDTHARLLADRPRFRITAAADPIPERRIEAERKLGCLSFPSLDAALAAGQAELAVICTCTSDRYLHTLAALRAGCHVLVETPAALSPTQMRRMIAAAEKAHRILTVYQWPEHPELDVFLRETIDSGILGRITSISYRSHQFVRRNDWQTVERLSGGAFYRVGCWHLAQLLALLDSPVKRAWAWGAHTVSAGDADDAIRILAEGYNGRLIEVDFSYSSAFPVADYLLCGTTGSMRVAGGKATIRFFDPAAVQQRPKLSTAPPPDRQIPQGDFLPWQEKTVDVRPSRPVPDFYDSLYRSIRYRARLLVAPESVLKAMEIAERLRKAAKSPCASFQHAA